jgi:quercetin dioxygenase-like cupin family protein
MTTTTQAPIIRDADEGEKRWFYGGALLTWKASSTETNGAFSLWEASMARDKVTPLHTHPADETMYMLEGEILVHMDGQEYRVAAGGLAFAPRGVPHAFMVLSDVARLITIQTPGSCEAFYYGASEPAGADGSAPSISTTSTPRQPRTAGSKSSDHLHSLSPEPLSGPRCPEFLF